jgi:TRAP-type C4-dicarboxylate transport system permease small subunit
VRQFDWAIEKFEDFVVAAGLAIATIATFGEVVARKFGHSIGSGGEMTTTALIWAAMIGAAVAARTGVHIGVDVLIQGLPRRIAKVIVLTSLLLSAVFVAWIAYQGTIIVQRSFESGQVTLELQWPRWPLYLSVPVGMILMAYHLLREFLHRLHMPAEHVFEDVGFGLDAGA